MAHVVSINISTKKGEKKKPITHAEISSKGIEGDAHSGDWHRQISLLAEESIDKMRGKGVELKPGDFAENITTEGIDLLALDIGQRLCVGNVLLEITQKGKECHHGCAIRQQVGDCVMPREGVFAKVVETGEIRTGSPIALEKTL